MSKTTPPADYQPERESVITRVFNAPRERVWKVWTEAEHLARWWGPKGFTVVVATLDLRPGGIFHYAVRASSGLEMWGKLVYGDVVAPERLVYINSFSDKDAGMTRHPMSATWPLEVFNTLTLTEQDGKTTLTMRGGPINATEAERKTFEDARDSVHQGTKGMLDELEAYLESPR